MKPEGLDLILTRTTFDEIGKYLFVLFIYYINHCDWDKNNKVHYNRVSFLRHIAPSFNGITLIEVILFNSYRMPKGYLIKEWEPKFCRIASFCRKMAQKLALAAKRWTFVRRQKFWGNHKCAGVICEKYPSVMPPWPWNRPKPSTAHARYSAWAEIWSK